MWVLVNVGFERPFYVGAIVRPSKSVEDDLRLARRLEDMLNKSLSPHQLKDVEDREIEEQVRSAIGQYAGDELSYLAIAKADVTIHRWSVMPKLGQPVPDGAVEILSSMSEGQKQRVKWDIIRASSDLRSVGESVVTALGLHLDRFLKHPSRYQRVPGIESLRGGKALPCEADH